MAFPLLIPMIGGLLMRATPALVSGVLRALGMSAITYVGMDIALDQAHDMIKANLTGLPVTALAFAGLLKFDVAVEIIFASIMGRMVLNAMSGSFTKMSMKKK